jgi:hypothetical protein
MRVGKRGVMMNEIWSLVWRFRRGAMQGKMVWVSTTPIASNQSKPLPGKPFGSVRKTTTDFFPSLSIPFFLSFRFCPERVLANLELCPSETRSNRTKLPFSVCLVSRRLASRRHVASCRVASLLPSFLQGSAPCYGVQDACVKHYNELVNQTIGSEPNVPTPVNISTTAYQIQTGWSPRSERSFER